MHDEQYHSGITRGLFKGTRMCPDLEITSSKRNLIFSTQGLRFPFRRKLSKS